MRKAYRERDSIGRYSLSAVHVYSVYSLYSCTVICHQLSAIPDLNSHSTLRIKINSCTRSVSVICIIHLSWEGGINWA